jgi:putative membrane protein
VTDAVVVDDVARDEDGWSRLHPLTPLLRGGRFFLAAVAVVGQQGLREAPARTLLIGLAAVVPIGLALGLVAWWTTRYRLTATELQVDTGVLRRRNRRVPLARLQSVDVVRPFTARLLGLAELRLEVAGGGQTEAPLAYLGEDAARRLRAQLLRAAGTSPAGGEAPDAEAPEAVLVQVPTGALVASALLSVPVLLMVAALVALVGVVALRPGAAPALLTAVVPFALGTGGVVLRRLLAEYGFTVAQSPDGLLLRHGLLDTRQQTIPYGRVQTVRVLEPLLWRRRGWVRVEVDVAGYSGTSGEEQATTSALLPVAPRELALSLVDRVLGAPVPLAVLPAPRRARLRAPLSARRLRLGLDARHLVTATGVLTTTTDVVPLVKVQSLRLEQGPWQRRLALASVHADTAGRRLRGGVVRHRDAAEAALLLADLTRQMRAARAPAPGPDPS